MHISCHGLAFSKSAVFRVFLWAIPGPPCDSFFYVIYPVVLSVMFFSFSYSTPKFFYIWLFVCTCTFSSHLLVELSFIILEYSVLFALLESVSEFFVSPFFCQYHLSYLSELYSQTYLFCFGFFFILMRFYFLSTFRCCRNFFYLSF